MTSIGEPSLAVGEAALNEGDYNRAIAHLEGVCEIEIDEEIVSRAQKALVVAYSKGGKLKEAIALCESLCQLPQEQVWASKALSDLQRRYSKLPQQPSSGLPVVVNQQPSVKASVFTPGRVWRNGERAKNWQRFKKLKLRQLLLVQLFTVVAFVWLLRVAVNFLMGAVNSLLVWLPQFVPIQLFYRDSGWVMVCLCVILFIASPWLLDGLLRQFYGLESFRLAKLANQCPETAKAIQSYCRQYKLPLPTLGILPTNAPVAMTYGNLPRTARLVISEGLIEQLEDGELATICLTQLAYISQCHFILMSAATAWLQLAYTLYWQTAMRGESLYEYVKQRFPKPPKYIHPWIWQDIPPLILATSTIFSALFYGCYWLLRFPWLWLSRTRVYYGDRIAAEVTGDPNALCRALLKIAIGMAHNIKQNSQTSWLLEGFDILMPVGFKQAISLGSVPDYTPLETVLSWDCLNPYRHWLKLTNSHPLMGERLFLLCRYAYFWKVQPELDLPPLNPPARGNLAKLRKALKSYRALPILQSAVLSGILFGSIARAMLWCIGILSDWLSGRISVWWLIWLHNGRAIPFIQACILGAFSLSIIIWINGYFPDVKIAPKREEPRIQDLLSNRDYLPPDSEGVRLTGILLGRQGMSNGWAQDLILDTDTGAIKLHFYSQWGLLGNLIPQKSSFQDFIQQRVTVKGWLRRGGTTWIDVDSLRLEGGKTLYAGYPIWVTGLAVLSAIYSAYLILQI